MARLFSFALLPLLFLLADSSPLRGQEAATLTGRVTEEGSGRPLEAVQIYLPDQERGSLTRSNGRYLIQEVEPGELTVRAERIGYGTRTETLALEPGETGTLDVVLSSRTIALDEMVVTGAGQETQIRQLGNTVARIGADELANAPAANFSELLQGREPGVMGLPSGGATGEGARIRIRGSASLSQSNEPLVYVDGVRVDNGGGFSGRVRSAGAVPSRLDDIPPEAIERIEVLKGAAAATLYGTEASNGVIQIFTKRGQEGPARWRFSLEQGVLETPPDRMIPFADWPRNEQDVERIQGRWGIETSPYEPFQVDFHPDFFETGHATTFSGSVSGGTSEIEYYVSGRYSKEDGSFGLEELGPARDVNEKRQASATLSFFGAEDVRLRLSTFYSELDHEALNINNTIHGAWPVSYRAKIRLANQEDRLYGNPFISTVREGMQIRNTQDATNFSGSLNLSYTPLSELNLDATIGVSRVSQRDVQIYPFGWNVDIASAQADGRRDLGVRDHREITGDLKAGWNTDVTSTVTSGLTVGTQAVVSQTNLSGGRAEVFPGPGLQVGSAASEQLLDESFQKNATAGFFVQEQIGYRDFAFLTLGSRLDANSAFGEEFSFAHYPKASVSVIPSDLPGWPSGTVSTFRLRAAVGQSGLQPGAFDQFTTFEPVNSSEGPGVAPDNLGNPELSPEISTEWEIGGEVGLLDDRVAFELTYWDRQVSDALVAREFPVSGGFRQPQLDNVGRLDAHGVEVGVEGRAYSSRWLTVELSANAAYLNETVADMGAAPPLKVGGSYVRYRNWVKEGYAPGAFFGPKVADEPLPLDLDNDCMAPSRAEALEYFEQPRALDDFEVLVAECGTPAAKNQYLGKPTPNWQGSFGTTIDFLDDFRLSTLFEFRAGDFWVHDLSGGFRRSNRAVGRNTPEAARIEATVNDPSSSAEERLEAALDWTSFRALSPLDGLNEVHRADFLRWRELSLSYSPSSLATQLGFERLSVTLGARNLELWVHDDYTGLDPEINQLGRCEGGGLNCNFLDSVEAWGLPLQRRFSVRLTVEP